MNGRLNDIAWRGEGYYVSYIPSFACRIQGDTTAVVVGQGKRFYILKGNHTKALQGVSWSVTLRYLHNNASQLHNKSEALPPLGSTVEDAIRIGWHLTEEGIVWET